MSLTIIKSQYNISKDGQVRKWNLSKYLVVRVLRKRPRGAARGGSAALTSGPDAESQVLNQQRLFSRLGLDGDASWHPRWRSRCL